VGQPNNIIDLFAGKRAQRILHNLFAQFVATYDERRAFIDGRLTFVLCAPGAPIDLSLLRSLTARITDPSTGASHEARITTLLEPKTPIPSVYWLRTDVLTPFREDMGRLPANFRLELISSDGKHRFERTARTEQRARND
jgi:hypothetical protein